LLNPEEIPSCRPPDPDTRKPQFRMPPGACDTHCHVFGPAHLFPFAPERRYTPPDASREKLAALHTLLGVDRAVIVQASCHGSDNSAMLDTIARSDGKYRGVCNARGTFSEGDFTRAVSGACDSILSSTSGAFRTSVACAQ
jgi:2-pyrone-4,6-dicarboxylate lactonase